MEKIIKFLKSFLGIKPSSKAEAIDANTTVPVEDTQKSKTDPTDRIVIYKGDARLYNPFNWVRHVLLWTNGMILCLILINIIVWGGFYLQSIRDYQVIDLKTPLISQVYNSLDNENDIQDIDIKRRTQLILNTLHNFSFSTSQDFSLITGMVSPDIISNAEAAYRSNHSKLNDTAMVQSISVTEYPLISSNKNGKITVIVKGYLLVLTQLHNTSNIPARTVPYRAELTYLVRPATHLTGNKTLYLAAISETAGMREASMFDEALKSKITLLK